MLRAQKRLVSAVIGCALAAFATGCSPVVSLHHTEVRGVSSDGVGIVAHLVVENENAFDVEVRSVRANVTMAGRWRLAPVDIQPNKWLASGRKTRIAVPLTVPWTSVPGVLAASAGSSAVPYRITGVANVTASRAGRFRAAYPIDDEGTVPRSTLARGAPGGLGLPF